MSVTSIFFMTGVYAQKAANGGDGMPRKQFYEPVERGMEHVLYKERGVSAKSEANEARADRNSKFSDVSVRDLGTKEYLKKKKRRDSATILSTPAIRLGADKRSKGADMEKAPDLRRVLYLPWLFHGTPCGRNSRRGSD